MHGLTKALAREFGPHGVTANTIAPSNVDTARDWSKYPQEARILADVPLARRADPKEIAATCLFLASPGGGYISGQAIHVNGGYKMF
jgi:3-oxoacyl-[acyl-carrier protein] reductase